MERKEMKCLCCNKNINEESNEKEELFFSWHKKCIHSFFGTDTFPEIDINEETLMSLATKNTKNGFTVPGVQKKLSLNLTEEKNPRLTLLNYPNGYILKPQTEEYSNLPEAEYVTMLMAKLTGIKTVPFALIKVADSNYAYITKRIDRVKNNDDIKMLAMEDFCQLDNRLTKDKYKGSYERCAKIIKQYSSRPGFDLSELYLRLVFSYAVGNSDMHLKNFSLIETSERSKEYVLSSAYDMLPVNSIIPSDKDEFALTMNGKKRNIRKKDFLEYSTNIGLSVKSAEKIIKIVISKEQTYQSLIEESYLPQEMKLKMMKIIKERIGILKS